MVPVNFLKKICSFKGTRRDFLRSISSRVHISTRVKDSSDVTLCQISWQRESTLVVDNATNNAQHWQIPIKWCTNAPGEVQIDTDVTDFIPSTSNAGGKNIMVIGVNKGVQLWGRQVFFANVQHLLIWYYHTGGFKLIFIRKFHRKALKQQEVYSNWL